MSFVSASLLCVGHFRSSPKINLWRHKIFTLVLFVDGGETKQQQQKNSFTAKTKVNRCWWMHGVQLNCRVDKWRDISFNNECKWQKTLTNIKADKRQCLWWKIERENRGKIYMKCWMFLELFTCGWLVFDLREDEVWWFVRVVMQG